MLGLLIKHQGHLKSPSTPGKKSDAAPEAALAAVLAAGQPGRGGYTLLARPTPEHVQVSAAVEVQQLLMAGRRSEALRHVQYKHLVHVNLWQGLPNLRDAIVELSMQQELLCSKSGVQRTLVLNPLASEDLGCLACLDPNSG